MHRRGPDDRADDDRPGKASHDFFDFNRGAPWVFPKEHPTAYPRCREDRDEDEEDNPQVPVGLGQQERGEARDRARVEGDEESPPINRRPSPSAARARR